MESAGSGKWASSSSAGFDAQHLGVTRALGNFQLTTLKHRAKDNRLWEGPLTAGEMPSGIMPAAQIVK